MNYESMRQFADSWGLLFMAVLWISFALWLFRPGGKRSSQEAANMIFAEDEMRGEQNGRDKDDD